MLGEGDSILDDLPYACCVLLCNCYTGLALGFL